MTQAMTMTRSATLNIRIQDDLKSEAAEVLATYGLTLSDAVRVFLTSVARTKGLPPELVMSNEAYDKWMNDKLEFNLKNRGQTMSAEEFIDSV